MPFGKDTTCKILTFLINNANVSAVDKAYFKINVELTPFEGKVPGKWFISLNINWFHCHDNRLIIYVQMYLNWLFYCQNGLFSAIIKIRVYFYVFTQVC